MELSGIKANKVPRHQREQERTKPLFIRNVTDRMIISFYKRYYCMCGLQTHGAPRFYLSLTHSWDLAMRGGKQELERTTSPTSLRLICFSQHRSPAVDPTSPLNFPPPPFLLLHFFPPSFGPFVHCNHCLLLCPMWVFVIAMVCVCVYVCACVLILNHFCHCLFRWAT